MWNEVSYFISDKQLKRHIYVKDFGVHLDLNRDAVISF